MTTNRTTPSAVPAAAIAGASHKRRRKKLVLAQPTTKPARQAARADKPERRVLQEQVAQQPRGETDDGALVRAPDEPGAHRQEQHEVRGDVVNPQVVAETGLDEDAQQQDDQDLEPGLDPSPAHNATPRRCSAICGSTQCPGVQPVCGDQSRTRTNWRLTRSAYGLADISSWSPPAGELTEETVPTGIPGGKCSP